MHFINILTCGVINKSSLFGIHNIRAYVSVEIQRKVSLSNEAVLHVSAMQMCSVRQRVTRHLNCVVLDVFVLRSPPFCLQDVFCAAELVNGLSQ